MIDLGFYITLQVTIVGVGIPVLLQVISRLDDKYNSTSILSLFKREWAVQLFIYSLVFSLIATIVWTLQLPPYKSGIEWFDALLPGSSKVLVVSFSIVLLVSFLFVSNTIYIFYTFEELIPHIINKADDKQNFRLQSLRDLLIFLMLAKGKEEQFDLIRKEFDERFKMERDRTKKIEYSPILQDTIVRIAQLQNRRYDEVLPKISKQNLSSRWLTFDPSKYEYTSLTYSLLWTVIEESVIKGNADLYMDHWDTADSVVSMLDTDIMSLPFEAKDEQERLLKEKSKFVRFHYSLGGLVLYSGLYSLIARMFRHTRSQPYAYNLLPRTMTEIFDFYRLTRVGSPLDYDETFFYKRFPGTEGIRSESTSIGYIAKYTALLFLRQFTLSENFGIDPIADPRFPDIQPEMQIWIDNFPWFKKIVEEQYDNDDLMSTTQLTLYSQLSDKTIFLEKLNTIEETLKHEFELMKQSDEMDEKKLEKFRSSSKAIIDSGLKRIKENLSSSENEIDDRSELQEELIIGTREMKMPKDAFITNSLIHQTDFDTYLARTSINQIERSIQDWFFDHRTINYNLAPEDLKEALLKLDLSNNQAILNIGSNLDYFLWDSETGKRDARFDKLEIRELNNYNNSKKGLYILNKQDIPIFSPQKMEESELDGVRMLSNEYNAYFKLTESTAQNPDDELSVDAGIYYSLSFKWKSEIKIVYIKMLKDYEVKGQEDKPENMDPF